LCGRFRFEGKSPRVLTELKTALVSLAQPLLQTYQAFTQLAQQHAGDRKMLRQLFAGLLYMTRIFYDLNFVDLPGTICPGCRLCGLLILLCCCACVEFFEDHIVEWMTMFDMYLGYGNPLLEDDSVRVPRVFSSLSGYCPSASRSVLSFGSIPDYHLAVF